MTEYATNIKAKKVKNETVKLNFQEKLNKLNDDKIIHDFSMLWKLLNVSVELP